MRVLKNFEKSSVDENPKLKCRYSKGLGDIVACILHSKYIGKLTYKITGSKVPCEMCSRRASALNVLLPIPFWKLFFKSEEHLKESLIKDLKLANYEVHVNEDDYLFASKLIETPLKEFANDNTEEEHITHNINRREDYNLISTNDNYMGEFLIQTLIYKHK